jgi:hypothetical protein
MKQYVVVGEFHLEKLCSCNITTNKFNELWQSKASLTPLLTPSPSDCHNDTAPELSPDVAKIAAAWPILPEAIRAGILAMVAAAGEAGK